VKLAGAESVFYEMEYDENFYVPKALNLEYIENMLKETNPKALIITSPTYEGTVSDIKALKALCEKFDTYFKKKILNFKLSKEIAYLFITQIGQLLKLKIYLLFEKYKLELNLNDSLIYLPQNIRQIIYNLNENIIY
jgi:arginine/lysine/ornithine decarboxylase